MKNQVAGKNEFTSRQMSEANFHDRWAENIAIEAINIEAAFSAPTAAENQFILRKFGSLEGKRILDLGCGMGDASIFFALHGAEVSAIDISSGMIKVTTSLAERHGVSEKVCAIQMPAENLEFQDNSFDLIYGNGVLHHVDIQRAIAEAFRVVKPGGKLAFIEPLSYNPLIWVYRIMAQSVRSKDEHPLRITDIRKIMDGNHQARNKYLWSQSSHTEFHMFTLLIMVWFLIGKGVLPSEERYWKLFVERGDEYRKAYALLSAMDRFIQTILPPMRWLCWNTVIHLEKKLD